MYFDDKVEEFRKFIVETSKLEKDRLIEEFDVAQSYRNGVSSVGHKDIRSAEKALTASKGTQRAMYAVLKDPVKKQLWMRCVFNEADGDKIPNRWGDGFSDIDPIDV